MRKTIFMCAAAVALSLGSCQKERVQNPVDGNGVAYISIEVAAKKGTRASTEAPGANESELNALYLVTFDATGSVMGVPGSTLAYSFVDATTGTQDEAKKPNPIKISSASKKLLVVANPGDKLKNAITSLRPSSSFESFNAAIGDVQTSEITSAANGFAMISAGDEANPVGGKVISPLVDIGGKIQVVGGTVDEPTAISNAKTNRLPVKLERLTAKLVVRANPTRIAAPDNAEVILDEWTVDAVNTTFYPFAEKTLLGNNHSGTDYVRNFYTRDPNYVSDPLTGYAEGLKYVTIDAAYKPVLPFNYTWMLPGDATNPLRIAYVIENTMAADEQKTGSATRVVMRATYHPAFTSGYTKGGDWFSWAGTDYASLAALQLAYKDTGATSTLKDACDRFLKRVKTVNHAIATDDFTLLTQDQLNDVPNGGQVVKEGADAVIEWYQKGQCYYSYEVRHDDAATGASAFGKYGVVRNNWYDLTLNSVKGPGTPWYPESENPGPGDPDPKDPIDTHESYLGVSITINDWVLWTTDMDDVD